MTGTVEKIGEHVEAAKESAISAYSEAQRMGMLRMGNPWEPIAEAIVFCGVVIANGDKSKYRTWSDCGPEWTADIFEATWYVRKSDAERACLCDEDGWHILGVGELLREAMAASQ